ncbi:MAG: hypothetical protein KAI70_07935 [Candidatus Omnitrophica bacterium]|nr:hypothetical protein [Candidatus Omnitrophota bacterium]
MTLDDMKCLKKKIEEKEIASFAWNYFISVIEKHILSNDMETADKLIDLSVVVFEEKFGNKTRTKLAMELIEYFWKSGKKERAIVEYEKADRPFWQAEMIAEYLEERGKEKQSIREYEYLIDEYLKISEDFLPLPNGPEELFKLGKWYSKKEAGKATKYLELYLSAREKCQGDPVLCLVHEEEAEKILKELLI